MVQSRRVSSMVRGPHRGGSACPGLADGIAKYHGHLELSWFDATAHRMRQDFEDVLLLFWLIADHLYYYLFPTK